MSFSQHLVLWLHVAFVIFTIGPARPAQGRARGAGAPGAPPVGGGAGQGGQPAPTQGPGAGPGGGRGPADQAPGGPAAAAGETTAGTGQHQAGEPATAIAEQLATVERGRIAMIGGVVSLIWLVSLVLMIWNS